MNQDIQVPEPKLMSTSDSTENVSMNTKKFTAPFVEIQYQNSTERNEKVNGEDIDVKISNRLCYEENGVLVKITEIESKNSNLKIIDHYHFKYKQQSARSNVVMIEKTPIKRFNFGDQCIKSRKDAKNLVKNLVNLFCKWLKRAKPNHYGEVLQRFRSIFQKNKHYNKNLIKSMTNDRNTCLVFIQFCQQSAFTMIEQSRINEKQFYCKALNFYKQLFEDGLSCMDHRSKE